MDWLADDADNTEKDSPRPPWKVVIVDDDNEVHKITALALKAFEFENRGLEFLHAYSGQQAREFLLQHHDIAVLLLDVVMESDDEGFRVVQYVREQLGNHFTRIILRTGQPGDQPEEDVIRRYDIDGYKAKTEFRQHTLSNLFFTALRSYRDLVRLQQYQYGLEALITTIRDFNNLNDFERFASTLLAQVCNILNAYQSQFILKPVSFVALGFNQQKTWQLEAHNILVQGCTSDRPDSSVLAETAFKQKKSLHNPPMHAFYSRLEDGDEAVMVISLDEHLDKHAHKLITLFCENISVIARKLLIQQEEPLL